MMIRSRILIGEGDLVIAEDLRGRLNSLGYDVAGITSSGTDAVTRATALRPDMVLMDLDMGGPMDAMRAAETIRRQCGIPVVYLTANADERKLRRAKITAPSDYIIKPFAERELHSTIEMAFYKHRTEGRLKDSERRLAATLRVIDEAVIAVDNGGNILFMNPVAELLTGWNQAEALHRSLAEVFATSRDGQSVVSSDLIGQVLRRDAAVSRENHTILRSRDGSTISIDQSAAPMKDDEGNVIGVLLAFRDVEARRRSEESIRENERRFQMIARLTKNAVWEWNLREDTIWYSESFGSVFGYPPEAIEAGQTWRNARIHPEDRPHVLRSIQSAIEERWEIWSAEYRFLRGDGDYTLVEDLGQLVQDDAGAPVRMIGAITDISGRRRAEDQLREQAALLDITRDAILVRNSENRILYWNKGAELLYGWNAEEVLGKNADELLYKQGTHRQRNDAYKSVLERGEWTGELNHITKAGKAVIVDSRWTLMCDREGSPKSILYVNTDISGKKQMEAQFRRTQRLEIIGTLAGGIAHDLNNVLAPIPMAIQLLRSNVTDERTDRMLATIETSTHRGAEIVKQVLTFARGVEGERVKLQPKHVMREMEDIARETFPKNILIRSDISKELWPIVGDATQLHQILLNLCVNARDAMPEGGILTLEGENVTLDENSARLHHDAAPGPYVVLSVSDTGMGISSETIDKIFDPFFTTKDLGKGTGLGLSTVLGVVRGHGGFITVYSEVGRGSTFKAYIPAVVTGIAKQAHQAHPSIPRGHGETILVIDDEIPILEITKETLETFGYSVMTAQNGAEGVAIFEEHRHEIGLVVTDMMMPFMDGAETIHELRRIDPSVKIIAASGLMDNGKSFESVKPIVCGYLSKPWNAEKLLSGLRDVFAPDRSKETSRH